MSGFPYGFPFHLVGGTWPFNKRRRMNTEASICNLALSKCGSTAFIDSLTEDTAEARACRLLYAHCRDKALEEFNWPFARRFADLSPLTDVERSNWGHAFALPTNCIAVRGIVGATRNPVESSKIPFSLVANDDGDGKILLCDQDEVEIEYTKRITAVTVFPTYFCEVVAWLLARELAMPLSVRPDLRQAAVSGYEMDLVRAKAMALTEGHETEPDSELVTVRG